MFSFLLSRRFSLLSIQKMCVFQKFIRINLHFARISPCRLFYLKFSDLQNLYTFTFTKHKQIFVVRLFLQLVDDIYFCNFFYGDDIYGKLVTSFLTRIRVKKFCTPHCIPSRRIDSLLWKIILSFGWCIFYRNLFPDKFAKSTYRFWDDAVNVKISKSFRFTRAPETLLSDF